MGIMSTFTSHAANLQKKKTARTCRTVICLSGNKHLKTYVF